MAIRIYSTSAAKKEAERILSEKREDEVFEVKEKKNGFDKTELGQYFSALSNEASLRNIDNAWIFFGIRDDLVPVGTTVLPTPASRAALRKEIADLMTNRITFVEIYEIELEGKRVLMFQIPAVPNVVMMYNGIAYGRDGESLVGLNLEKINRLQFRNYDWSNELVEHTAEDLDREAVEFVRTRYIINNPHLSEMVSGWTAEELFSQLGLIRNGKLTKAAVVLFGDPMKITESEYNFTMTWMLKDQERNILDYEHFSIPFILSADKVLGRLTNLTTRRVLEGLFSEDFKTYDPLILREALNNSIAHADYRVRSRINIIELQNDAILFCNPGAFLPNKVESVLLSENSTSICRNKLMSNTLYRLGMVDSVGLGIKRIFKAQIDRAFPLPDYSFDEFGICLKITGHSISNAVTNIVHFNKNLSMKEILSLDRYQKGIKLNEEDMVNLVRIRDHCKNGDMLTGVVAKFPKRRITTYSESKASAEISHIQKQIIEYLASNPQCPIAKLSEDLDIRESTVRYNLDKLIDMKKISKEGRGKKTSWIVNL